MFPAFLTFWSVLEECYKSQHRKILCKRGRTVNGKPLVLRLKIAALPSGCSITCFVFYSFLVTYLTMEPSR